MKDEIAAAVVFVTKIIRKGGVSKDRVDKFKGNLTSLLLERFKDHWYETVPSRGQGYRCIRVNDTDGVDPVLIEAARKSGLCVQELGLPSELTLWVDPTEVSCRLGENRGAFCTVALFYDGSSENKAKTINVDEILAVHLERKQAEHAKFLKATSTRSRRKDRNSPPNGYGLHGPGGLPHGPVYNGMGWEDPHVMAGAGYYNNSAAYEVEIEEGIHNSNTCVNNWGNWVDPSHIPQQQPHPRISPDHITPTPSSPAHDNKPTNNNVKKVCMATGGSHLGKNSTSHSPNKFRWVKQADAAQA